MYTDPPNEEAIRRSSEDFMRHMNRAHDEQETQKAYRLRQELEQVRKREQQILKELKELGPLSPLR